MVDNSGKSTKIETGNRKPETGNEKRKRETRYTLTRDSFPVARYSLYINT
jgi:hypothetical protein